MSKLQVFFLFILAAALVGIGVFLFQPAPQSATTKPKIVSTAKEYFVNPSGGDFKNGLSKDEAFITIQKAVDLAQPGDVINLAPGIYKQDVISKRSGTQDARIIITGPKDAIVKGGGGARIIEIQHSFITVSGFTVDGLSGVANSKDGFRDKLVYVQGKENKKGVTGFKLTKMTLQNAGGECVRLRYFAMDNEISENTIKNCGVWDFKFDGGGKNGEGVYIGTAPEQLADGKNPTIDPDQSTKNWVHHNIFDTQGNECVDIKESSIQNLVEHNKCTGQKDPESGGMDSRGGENTFRNNEIYGNLGAGVRLGGDTVEENINNNVYQNNIYNNKAGGIKIVKKPQGKICGNTMKNNGKNIVGDSLDPLKPC